MSSFKIAVILPSRGLLYAETFKEVLENCEPYRFEIFFAHGLPIPDCFNEPLNRALKKKFTHIWFVEEDMVIPPDTLTKLLEQDEEMIACDYPVIEQPSCAIQRDPDGKAYFTGTGCLLIKYDAIKKMQKPVFRSDIRWQINSEDKNLVLTPEKVNSKKVYGYHDVTFGLKRYIQGKPIVISDIICFQRKLIAKGKNDTNQGQDTITIYDKFAPTLFDPLNRKPSEEDKLLVHIHMDKQNIYAQKEHAERLIAAGTAKRLEQTYDYLTIRFHNRPELIDYICVS